MVCLKSHFPVKSDYYSSPSVSFSYSKTIRSAIVNYKETLVDPDLGNIICHYDQYPMEYVNAHHGHIVTSNVNIVLNRDLRILDIIINNIGIKSNSYRCRSSYK